MLFNPVIFTSFAREGSENFPGGARLRGKKFERIAGKQ
jgi:hypothetical protein